MNAIIKRLVAAIMATAMMTSLTPVTGAAVFADETETDVPSVSEDPAPPVPARIHPAALPFHRRKRLRKAASAVRFRDVSSVP